MLHIGADYSKYCTLTDSNFEHTDKSAQKKEKLY